MSELSDLPEGITKEVVRRPPSEKYMCPQHDDEIEMHCVATLSSGVQFDSTRDRGEPLKLRVGHGDVIAGWDLAARTLRKGEVARFTIAPHFAFGDVGSGEEVPPGSTVVMELEIIKCPKRHDLFEDGGVIKLETKEGEGQFEPRVHEEVQISYKVAVEGDGIVGAARHAVYQMKTGALGHISEAIDKALGTMKRGDEVTLTCRPKYAFGTGGRFANMAATVTLILEQIYEVLDVSLGEKDRTVMKKRTVEGTSKDKARDTARVSLRVESVTANADKLLESSLPRDIAFVAGDGEVCDSLECSVVEMKEGEEAVIRCSKPDWCVGGLLGLPAHMETPVLIKVKLLSFERAKERWDMTDAERLERCQSRKARAGELVKCGRIRLAAHHYDGIAAFFEQAEHFRDEEHQMSGRELRRLARLNRALCMLRLGDWKAAKALCSTVLRESPESAKALFRRGVAEVELREYAEAIADLQRCLDVEDSADAGRLLQRARRLKKETEKKQTPVFAGMCRAFGQMPERTDRRDDQLFAMPDSLRLGYRESGEQPPAAMAAAASTRTPSASSAECVADEKGVGAVVRAPRAEVLHDGCVSDALLHDASGLSGTSYSLTSGG